VTGAAKPGGGDPQGDDGILAVHKLRQLASGSAAFSRSSQALGARQRRVEISPCTGSLTSCLFYP
jgi:hypothetical protein